MRAVRQILPILLALTISARAGATPAVPDTGCIRGVTLSLFHPGDRAGVDSSLARIAALHATHVCLLYTIGQHDVHSDSPGIDPGLTPPDSLVLSVASRARSLGLGVILFPLLHLEDTGPGRWRGALAPRSWSRWFKAYGNCIESCGRLAALARADWLCVGAELVTSERHARSWNRVIRRVRSVFPGKLFYSQNWDHLARPGFAGRLDRMGMNAYFELTPEPRPAEEALEQAWARIAQRLLAGRTAWIFTEVGYPSSASAAAKPWDYVGQSQDTPELQRDCMEAFFRTWKDRPQVRGVIIYWWSCAEKGEGTSYSIRDRPAEETVRSWFGRGFPCVREP